MNLEEVKDMFEVERRTLEVIADLFGHCEKSKEDSQFDFEVNRSFTWQVADAERNKKKRRKKDGGLLGGKKKKKKVGWNNSEWRVETKSTQYYCTVSID